MSEDIIRLDKNTCDNCWHCREGHCSLFSCDCATAVMSHSDKPPRWMSYEEGEAAEFSLLNTRGHRK